MSYQSPIELMVNELQTLYEDNIVKAVQEYNITVNKDELLMALQYDRAQYDKGYSDGWLARDREIVRAPIKGYEGSYEVDQFGRVFALDRTVRVDDNGRVYDKPIRERQLKQSVHSKGYKTVTLTKDGVSKTAFVHRLVAEAFIPNENNLPCINHKDEDKTNNFVENLEWCTVQYNSTYGKARQKQAAKLIGRHHTEEHKQKIAEGVKRFYRSQAERKDEV